MRLAVTFGTILVAGCASMSETIAGYSDEKLCSALRAGSSHSQQLYRMEAARRSIDCAPIDTTR